MIFVDTGAWFAFLVSDDTLHSQARTWVKQNREVLVLSDYVLDETLTLLRMRNQHKHAFTFGDEIFKGELAELIYLNADIIEEAWEVFQRYNDKGWSFTDCTSKVLMERMQITTAFAFDHHFRQFGTITVVP